MKRTLKFISVIILLFLIIIWLSPTRVVIHNRRTDESLTITNKGLIETLVAPLDNIKKDEDRIKTPYTNKLTIYKGPVPIKHIGFGMPAMFDDDTQIIVRGKPYSIDRTFYDVLRKIEKEKGFTLDTL